MQQKITCMRLDDIKCATRNPKRHADEAIRNSISHHGFAELPLLDERTGRLVAGHGRYEQLRKMKTLGDTPPDGITTDTDGEWLMPVITGWSSRSDADADAYIIGSNHLTTLGGWDTTELSKVLDELREQGLSELAGYTDEDIDDIISDSAYTENPYDYTESTNRYTPHTNVP